MNIMSWRGILPQIGEDVYIAPGARIVGDVVIGDLNSVWFNVVIRGDDQYVRIGSCTNIQDNSSLHVYGPRFPLEVGEPRAGRPQCNPSRLHGRRRMLYRNGIDFTGWLQDWEGLGCCRRFPCSARLPRSRPIQLWLARQAG